MLSLIKRPKANVQDKSTTSSRRDVLRIELPEHYGPVHKELNSNEKKSVENYQTMEEVVSNMKKVIGCSHYLHVAMV